MEYCIILKGRNDKQLDEVEIGKFLNDNAISKSIVKGCKIIPQPSDDLDGYVIILTVKTNLIDYFRIKKSCNGYEPKFGVIFPMESEEDLIKIREEFKKK